MVILHQLCVRWPLSRAPEEVSEGRVSLLGWEDGSQADSSPEWCRGRMAARNDQMDSAWC